MKKIISVALALSFAFGISTTALAVDTQEETTQQAVVLAEPKAAAPTNTAKATFNFPNGGGPIAEQEIIINGETYKTDKNGQLTTKALPYGHYTPQMNITSQNGLNNFQWAYTLMGQNISISQYSHMPQLEFLNNIYLYRKFNLSVIVVDDENLPVRDMVIEVHKNGNLLFKSSNTTCIAGVITFTWQEMPPSVSQPDSALYIGDKLVIKAVYKGETGKYESTEKPITLSSTQSENFVKLVSHKAGAEVKTVAPKLFETTLMPAVDGANKPIADKGKIDLVYDLGMNRLGNYETPADLDSTMFVVKDTNGNNVTIEKAEVFHNHVYLTYNTATYTGDTAPKTVSYTANEQGYLISGTDENAKVEDAVNVSIPFSFDTKTDAYYQAYEEEVLRLVNEERSSAGVPQLQKDNHLMQMARAKAQDMNFNAYFSHESFVYGFWHTQNKKFGYNEFYVSGENLANVPLSKANSREELTPKEAAEAAFIGWKNSPGHYSNILNPVYTRTGIGFSERGGFFTQSFGSTNEDKQNLVKVKVVPQDAYMGRTKVTTLGIKGTQTTLKAEANETFEFEGWYGTNKYTPVSTDNPYSFTIADNVELTARFQKAAYHYNATVKTVEYQNGTPVVIDEVGGSAEGSGDYYYGKPVTLTATEKDGYKFYGWYVGDVIIPNSLGGMPVVNSKKAAWQLVAGADTEVTAVFVKKEPQATLKIKINPSYQAVYGSEKSDANEAFLQKVGAVAAQSGIGATGGAFSEDGKTYLLATDDKEVIVNLKSYDSTNYKFLYWMVEETGEILEDVNVTGYYSASGLVKLSGNMTVIPVFGTPRFEVKAAAVGGIVTGKGYYDKGATVTLQAVPNHGYVFKKWSGTDNTESTIVIENLSKQETHTPVFEAVKKGTLTITHTPADLSEIGTISGGGSFSYNTYQTITATVKNDSERKFDGWYLNNDLVSKMPTYTFYFTEDATYTAKYSNPFEPYTLTATETAGGSLTVENNKKTYFYNQEATLMAYSKAGYVLKGWYENGRDLGNSSKLKLNITGDTEVEAKFVPVNSFTVTFRDIDGRIIKMETVSNGGRAIPPTTSSRVGYDFVGWNVSSTNLNKVSQDYEVIAQYKRNDTYGVTLTNGVIVTPQEDGYLFGNTVTVAADDAPTLAADGTTKTGLVFSHWERNGQIVSYTQTYSFMVDGDVSLTAVYTTEVDKAVPAPLIALNNTPMFKDGKLSFSTQVTMATGFELVECGVVLSQTVKDVDGANALTVDTQGSMKAKSTMQSTTGQFIITKVNATTGNWYGRGYMIYKDTANQLYTVYTTNVVSK